MTWGGSLGPCNASGTSQATNPPPGGWVSVTARYTWVPLALPYLFNGGITLGVQSSVPVLLAPVS